MSTKAWPEFSEVERAHMVATAKDALQTEGRRAIARLAHQFNIRRETLLMQVDPVYAARRRKLNNDRRRREWAPSNNRVTSPPRGDIVARLAEIPEDIRSPAQRLMGDPMPGDLRRKSIRAE